jgi:hypothetical protein
VLTWRAWRVSFRIRRKDPCSATSLIGPRRATAGRAMGGSQPPTPPAADDSRERPTACQRFAATKRGKTRRVHVIGNQRYPRICSQTVAKPADIGVVEWTFADAPASKMRCEYTTNDIGGRWRNRAEAPFKQRVEPHTRTPPRGSRTGSVERAAGASLSQRSAAIRAAPMPAIGYSLATVRRLRGTIPVHVRLVSTGFSSRRKKLARGVEPRTC